VKKKNQEESSLETGMTKFSFVFFQVSFEGTSVD